MERRDFLLAILLTSMGSARSALAAEPYVTVYSSPT
jgi:hypothetical protein